MHLAPATKWQRRGRRRLLPLPVAHSQSELRKQTQGYAFPQQRFKTKCPPRNEGQYQAAADGTGVEAKDKGQSCHQLLGWRHVRTCCMDTKPARAFSEHTIKGDGGGGGVILQASRTDELP